MPTKGRPAMRHRHRHRHRRRPRRRPRRRRRQLPSREVVQQTLEPQCFETMTSSWEKNSHKKFRLKIFSTSLTFDLSLSFVTFRKYLDSWSTSATSFCST